MNEPRLWLVVTQNTGVDRTPLQADHRSYMADLVAQGIVFASGPTASDVGEEAGGGATVLRVPRLSDVRSIMDREPYIRAGARTYSVVEWNIVHGDAVSD